MGKADGLAVGFLVSEADGLEEGTSEGIELGSDDGSLLGCADGVSEG